MRRQLPSVHSFSGYDVVCLLEHHAQARPQHPFIIWEPFDDDSPLSARTWSYRRFHDAALRVAAGLSARGIGRGDKVVIHMENCVEMLLAIFACGRLGAISVVTNSRSTADELRYFVEHSGAVGALTQPVFADAMGEAGGNLDWIVTADAPSHAEIGGPPPATGSFSTLFGNPESLPDRFVDANAPCVIFYTSGTTARPKGVVLTHANLLWGARVNAAQQAMVPDDVTLTFLPLFHINAQAYSILPSLWAGCTVVLQPRFSLSRFWDVALGHKATWCSIMTFCVNLLKERDVPAHSFRLWGEAICEPPSDSYFGIKTLGWFGMTETVAHPIVGHIDKPNQSMSMGRPAPEYDIAITREDGTDAEVGEVGQLCIGGIPGLSLFAEYLNNAQATDESFDEQGRFLTGDLVEASEDGFIRYRDRLKDMLKVRGENVAASEIERVIASMPEISEVAVVGRRDELHGQMPVAFVVPGRESGSQGEKVEDRVFETCRSKLADFKVPAEVRILEELPRSGPLAKIDKLSLRAEVNEEKGG